LATKHRNLVDAVAGLIALRKKYRQFRYSDQLKNPQSGAKNWDIRWIFPTGFPHHDNVNAIGFELRPPERPHWIWRGKSLVILLNGSNTGVKFHLPRGRWTLLADGCRFKVDPEGLAGVPAKGDYYTHPGTGVILAPASFLRRVQVAEKLVLVVLQKNWRRFIKKLRT